MAAACGPTKMLMRPVFCLPDHPVNGNTLNLSERYPIVEITRVSFIDKESRPRPLAQFARPNLWTNALDFQGFHYFTKDTLECIHTA